MGFTSNNVLARERLLGMRDVPLFLVVVDDASFHRLIKDIDLGRRELARANAALEEQVELGE